MKTTARDITQNSSGMTEHDMASILVVDDDESVCRFMTRLLDRSGYRCTMATDAAGARNYMKNQNFDLVLSDVNMPGESGIDLIRYSIATYPETAVIMVTGVDDQQIADTALELGAYGYIIKPFKSNELMINVGNALRRRRLEITTRIHQENLEKIVAERTEALQTTMSDLQRSIQGIIQVIAKTVETRDPYTAGHQKRVSTLACAIAQEMNLSGSQLQGIKMAGDIHDLGKLSVPAEILSKPTKLTDPEFNLIKTHPQVGYDILKDIEFPWPIAQIVYQHHERMDGSGYPQGLVGKEILLEARIMAVADVVEAMASHRPYRPALGIGKALEEIKLNKGVLYDPEVVDACLKLSKKKGFKPQG